MASDDLPIVKVQLKPIFHSGSPGIEPSIEITITIETLGFDAGTEIATLPSFVKAPVHPEHCLVVTDREGSFFIKPKWNPKSGTTWVTEKKSDGDLELKYIAHPEKSDGQRSPLGLYYCQEGFLGCGLSWLPLPKSDRVFRNVVEWNLERASESTRAVWTFGEGPGPVERIGPISVLSDSVYMVGHIQSTPLTSTSRSPPGSYGYYWFGDLPPNVEAIKEIHPDFALKAATFLDIPPPSADNPYRSFVRRNPRSKAFGGTCFRNSQIFDYGDQISQVGDYDLVRRMAYEMVHHWFGKSLLDGAPDILFQGVKNCLSIYLPFRNKFRTGHYFQATICVLCTRYYTSPLISLKVGDLLELAPTNAYAREQLEYRAWALVVSIDLRARRMSKLIRPIEDLAINPLVKERAEGNPYGIKEFLELLQPLMGEEAEEQYGKFCEGEIILLNPQLYGAKSHYLKQVDQEILDFGMDREGLEHGLVKDLKIESRAAKAGLKEGDKIVRSSHLWKCVDYFEEKMKIVVERDGKEVLYEYWPRAFEMAKSWQMVKVEE